MATRTHGDKKRAILAHSDAFAHRVADPSRSSTDSATTMVFIAFIAVERRLELSKIFLKTDFKKIEFTPLHRTQFLVQYTSSVARSGAIGRS